MSDLDRLMVNTIRMLSVDAVQAADSGHPGLPMGAAPMAYALWSRHMKFNLKNPEWMGRDRFILSAGHGSALLYSLLHLFGADLSLDEIKRFRQFGSKAPGHPEYGHTPGVEATTGPLGQGIANGVGMAIAEAYLASRFNRHGYPLVDNFTYVLCGDGCMMEGISSEAASLAGTLALGKLILLYDSNSITIEGSTHIAFREDVGKRFDAYGWHVAYVANGNDLEAISEALAKAKTETDKPSLIIITTEIGYGSPARQGKASAHGEPLGELNVAAARQFLGFDYGSSFYIPEEAIGFRKEMIQKGMEAEKAWNQLFTGYRVDHPDLAKEWDLWHAKDFHEAFFDEKFWTFSEKAAATRTSSSEILNRVAAFTPQLIGGSADLSPSTKTIMEGRGDFSADIRQGSNLHFGIREHAMAAVSSGLSLYGGLRVYASTFLIFMDYMKAAMRLSAMMRLPVIYILTHDSIGLGQDGPTHQPVEQLASLRGIPNMTDFRPADAKETAAGWVAALTRKTSPTALVLTRQNLPQFKETGKEALKGAYILLDSRKENPDIILIASGSEVQLVYQACIALKEMGIDARAVSMPSWRLFEEQSPDYKEKILPKAVRKRLAVEAGSSFGWDRYTGMDGDILSIDGFGASAPGEILFEKYGFTVDNVLKRALDLLSKPVIPPLHRSEI